MHLPSNRHIYRVVCRERYLLKKVEKENQFLTCAIACLEYAKKGEKLGRAPEKQEKNK